MAAPYILAKSLREAHVFAREQLGLERGRYRVVNTASTVSSMRGSDLYLVPGYENRFDRFAMRGALRYTRLNVIDVEQMQAEEPVMDDLEPAGVQLTLISNEEADAFLVGEVRELESHLEPEGFELSNEPDVQAIQILESAARQAEESAKPKRVRRRRCKECGELVLPDEVDAHAAEHLPTEE